uniref:Aminotransferase-like plant mobile domain-containing protein n=1 Tax=Fagus sylvatica TaxID=28930 RepID=A0A2N9F8B8_FAGSY
MVSLKDGNITRRIGRFLKPCVRYSNQAAKVPNVPLLSEFFSYYNQAWNSKVHFKGWKQHLKRWDEWIDKLAGKYGYKWNQTGICDAIMSSRYEIHCNRDLVLGLVEFWCAETNTFVFPWGEATITLEDVMILGGFPILGEQVTSSLSVELVEIEEEMKKLKKEFSRSKSKKANYGAWINYFMENENENEFEHLLICLRGTKIALAPAVLASLYQNLRSLKESVVTSLESITVLGLFQIVQLWAFERFPGLRTNGLKPLQPGEPRVAQWANGTNFKSTFSLPSIKWCVLKSAEDFEWRPYAADLENWCHLSYYKENEQLVIHNSSLDEDFGSFLRCLCASELVGLGCTMKKENVHFVIPPRSFQPGVSASLLQLVEGMCIGSERCNQGSTPKARIVVLRTMVGLLLHQRVLRNTVMSHHKLLKHLQRKKSNASCAYMFNSGIAKPKLEQIEEDVLSNPKFAQSSITNRKMKSEILQLFGSEKNEVKCHIPTVVKNQENSHKSGQESHAAKFSNVVTMWQKELVLLKIILTSNRKTLSLLLQVLSLEIVEKEKSQLVLMPMNWREGLIFIANGQNGAANEAHSEASESGNDLLDTAGLSKGIKQQNGSAKGGDEEGKKQKTGGSFDNPIDVDDYMQTIGSKSQNLGLVERIKKLEKLLGVKPK